MAQPSECLPLDLLSAKLLLSSYFNQGTYIHLQYTLHSVVAIPVVVDINIFCDHLRTEAIYLDVRAMYVWRSSINANDKKKKR